MKMIYTPVPLLVFLVCCLIFSSAPAAAQINEVFETETNNATVFSELGNSFTISSSANGPFRISTGFPGRGFNSLTADNVLVDNFSVVQPNTACDFSIASSDSKPFLLNSVWLYLARANRDLNIDGTLTITGFLGGSQVYSVTQTGGFAKTLGLTNGYSLVNMLVFGGSNNTTKYVDRIQFTTSSAYSYVGLDAFNYTPALLPVILSSPLLQTVCSGTAVSFTANVANASSYKWQEFVTSWTDIPNSGVYSGVNSTTLTISNSTSLGGRQYRLVAINANGNISTSGALLTVNPLLTTLAGVVAGLPYCVTQIGSLSGNVYADLSCRPFASVVATGSQPLTGLMETCVQLDPSTLSFNGQPYVQRHYFIAPVLNPLTATGNITMYYSQADFNAFNTARGTYPPLPTGPGDATGIANLRLTHFRGTGTAPGNYTGTPLLIDPLDANITWNAGNSYWEVTTGFTGLGGLYLHTGAVVLPVRLVSFAVSRQGGWNEIKWTSAMEENLLRYGIEHSSNGTDFTSVGEIAVNGNSTTEKSYSYRHNATGNSYYRLRMVEADGVDFSNIIRVREEISRTEISLVNNPARDVIRVAITTPQTGLYTFQLTDLGGRVLHRATRSVQTGTSTIEIRPAARPGRGLYLLNVETESAKTTLKVVVE
ncbi:MAG: T9SS type A sorting domain-containing protein [Chitinophagaceae bacterium]|nr:MAG: T9SS type A sorting domain-containing protein [Chitinophagaceae bacterium]